VRRRHAPGAALAIHEPEEVNMRNTKTVVISLILLVLLAQVGVAAAHETEPRFDPPTIEVTGKATVRYPPDFIQAQAGVTLRGADPSSVREEVREAAAEILAFVSALGVEERDVSTERISMKEAERDYDDDDCPVIPDEDERFVGHTSLQVVLRDFDKYEQLIAGLFEHGANRLGSVTFGSDKRTEKTREARVAAVRAAKEKAAYMAAELGQALGRPLEVTEERRRDYSAISNAEPMVGMTAVPTIGGSSISAGELSASAEVTIVFELLAAVE
jgi:uncharacterized protein YggE